MFPASPVLSKRLNDSRSVHSFRGQRLQPHADPDAGQHAVQRRQQQRLPEAREARDQILDGRRRRDRHDPRQGRLSEAGLQGGDEGPRPGRSFTRDLF